jgi:hypothetical protein
MSEEVADYLSTDFDISICKPVQTSVQETTETTYKLVASIDQSDLEFLIPADTYIDLDINVRGKLTKADGTNLDDRDFTACVNNLLHCLFSQCSIAFNNVTITQFTEIYNYRTYMESLLTYGTDAADTRLTNAFWYLDSADPLACNPTAPDAKN